MLTFDDASHTYADTRGVLPSVSEILRTGGAVPESDWRGAAVRAGMLRGRRVHRVSVHVDKGAPACDFVPAEFGDPGDPVKAYCGRCARHVDEHLRDGERGYLDAWQRFTQAVRPTWSHVEYRVAHNKLRYAGTLDRFGYLRTHTTIPAVVDLKTGGPRPWHRLQLAGYSLLMQAVLPIAHARVCVYLQPDGRFKIKQYDAPGDMAEFLWLLARHERMTHGRTADVVDVDVDDE